MGEEFFYKGGKEPNRPSLTEDGTCLTEPCLILGDELRLIVTMKQQSMGFLSDNNIIFPSNSTTSKTALSSSSNWL